MFRCKIVDFFFFVLPLKIWRDFLIRHHIQKCPVCQSKMASPEDVKSLLIQGSVGGNLDGLWPAVKAKLSGERKKEKRFSWPRLRWIAGAACLLAAVIAGIWLYSLFIHEKSPSKEDLVERFQINYIRIENKPARAFLFQPHDSNMIIIWAERNS